MGRLRRKAVTVAVTLFFSGWTLEAANRGPITSRVRTHHPTIRAAIDEAATRSATFRRLIETIEATDGLIYVESGSCRLGAKACLLHRVTIAGPFRVLSIRVNPRRASDELMASIGHELQHAVEVLSDRRVRTDIGVEQFYRVKSDRRSRARRSYETTAALDTGFAVLAELKRGEGHKRTSK